MSAAPAYIVYGHRHAVRLLSRLIAIGLLIAAIEDDYPALRDVQALPEWDQLRQEATEALRVFQARGKLPEDREVGSD